MKFQPRIVVVFGSQARETAGRQSDTDVAVLGDRPLTLEDKSDIAERIARQLNVSEDSLDIVDLWVASPLLQHQIAESGKLLEGRREDFIRFRVLAWKRYQDTAKFRRAREKALANAYDR